MNLLLWRRARYNKNNSYSTHFPLSRKLCGQVIARRDDLPVSALDPTLSPSVEALYCDHHDWLQSWLRRRLGNAADAANGYIRENPWKAISCGAVAGIVVALLISRR